MNKGFRIGYGDAAFCAIGAAVWIVYVTINGKIKVRENIKRLRWMKEHNYDIDKT